MENFLLSLNVVLPLFLEMALGYAIRCFRLVDEPTLRKMNNVVFRVFLPILLFYNVISTDIGTAFNGPLVLTAVLSCWASLRCAWRWSAAGKGKQQTRRADSGHHAL